MNRSHVLSALGALLVAAGASTPAYAYKCATSDCIPACGNPVTYAIQTTPKDLTPEQGEAEARRAIEDWAKVPCSSLKLTYRGRTTDAPSGNGVLGWTTAWTKGNGVVGQTGGMVSGSCLKFATVFNDKDFKWLIGTPPAGAFAVDTYSIVLHETGHLLGLDHSQNQDAVMYPSYGHDVDSITQDDADGICKVYPGGGGGVVGAPAGGSTGTGGAAGGSAGQAGTAGAGGAAPAPGAAGAPGSSGGVPGGGPPAGGPPAGGPPAGGPTSGGAGLAGEPCSVGSDCASNLCLASGGRSACSEPCAPQGGCPTGLTCKTMGSARYCVLPDGASTPPAGSGGTSGGASSTGGRGGNRAGSSGGAGGANTGGAAGQPRQQEVGGCSVTARGPLGLGSLWLAALALLRLRRRPRSG